MYAIDTETMHPKMLVNKTIGGEEGIDSREFARQLFEIDRARPETITIYINSFGGSVTGAIEIMNAIRMCKSYTIAHIYGMAYSAAGFVGLEADCVCVNDYARWMCHLPYDPDNLGEITKQQVSEAGLIAQIISNRSGKNGSPKISVERAYEMMKRETFLTGDELYQIGLADKVERSISVMAYATDEKELYNQCAELLNEYVTKEKHTKKYSMTSKRITELLNLVDGVSEETVAASIADLQNKIRTQNTQIDSLNNTKTAAETGLITLKTDLQNKVAEVADLTNKVMDLQANYAAVTAANMSLTKTNDELVCANTGLRTQMDTYNSEMEAKKMAEMKAKASELVNEAIEFKKIKENAREHWNALAEKDYNMAKLLLDDKAVTFTGVPVPRATGKIADTKNAAPAASDYFKNLKNSK